MSTQLVIDPASVSFEKIYNNLELYVKSKPDADSWKDFYDSGTGRTLLELIAGLATFRTFVTIVQRRENFLYHATARSSNIGISENLQYSVIRGQSPHYYFTMIPSESRLLAKYDLLGTYSDYDIIVLENTGITKNASISIPVSIGTLKTESLPVNQDSLTVFRFNSPDVSDDMILLLNDVEVPFDRDFIQLAYDKYVVISNAFGGVDVMYLNTLPDAAYKYGPGNTLQIKYFTAIDLLFDISEVTLFFGTYSEMSVTSNYIPPEPINDIKINAPLYHQTANLVRGRLDYKKLLMIFISGSVDTNCRDISPAVVELTYLMSDESVLSAAQKAALIIQLDAHRPFGVEPPSGITNPVKVTIAININVTLIETATGVVQSSVESDISTILATYEKKFECTVDIEEIERSINNLSYVKICRVLITNINNPWEPSVSVEGLEFVTAIIPDGYYYVCNVTGITHTLEPSWNNIPGNTTSDGTVTWICRDPNSTFIISGWNEYFIFNSTVTLI